MNRKVVIILVEAIIVLLFLLAVNFFYGLKMADVAVAGYESQVSRMTQLLNKSLAIANKSSQINSSLKSQIVELNRNMQNLEGENINLKKETAGLKVELERFKINADMVVPLKERVKAITASLDGIKLSSGRKEELDNLLRSIYEEVNSLDLDIARIAKDEPLYREVSRRHESLLKEKVEEAQKILMQNYQLNEKITIYQAQAKELNDKLVSLEQEKENNVLQVKGKEKQISDYEQQIDKLQKERKGEADELDKQKAEVTRLNGTLASLRQEKEAISGQKGEIEQKINENEGALSQRANRIVTLEDSLKKKTLATARIKEDMKSRFKELAGLRDKMVKVKIDNTRLKAALVEKEKAFSALKQEILEINKTNARFSETLDRAAKAFDTDTPPAGGQDKAVKVEIDSVAAGQEKGQVQDNEAE